MQRHKRKKINYVFSPNVFLLKSFNDNSLNCKEFERAGFRYNCLELNKNNPFAIIKFDDQIDVKGLLSVWGPKSGFIDVITDVDDIIHNVLAYDLNCYYNRFAINSIVLQNVKEVTVQLNNEIPSVELLKGEKDLTSRELLLAGIMYSKAGVLEPVSYTHLTLPTIYSV